MIKMCSACGNEKHLFEFRKDKNQKDGVQSRCKVCARAAINAAYETKYGEKTRARNQKRARIVLDNLKECRENSVCACCGEDCAACLDFHHTDPSTKSFSISKAGNRSWEAVLAEIKKCVVVCKNCHSKIHNGVLTLL